MALANTTKLHSLPPETFLMIISYLPPTSYTALVHTSHFFQSFFSTHAATICNTYILANHHTSSSLLQPMYIDGWLVPSHPAVAAQERQLGSCTQFQYFLTGSFEGRMLLSEPGPQYLMFLAQYDFEIRIRREMADREHADSGLSLNGRESAIENEDFEKRRAESEGIEDHFAHQIGTYAVRPFLRKLDGWAGLTEELRVGEARRKWLVTEERQTGGKTREVINKLKAKILGLQKKLLLRVKGWQRKLKKAQPRRELCFGEIESDGESDQFEPTKKGAMTMRSNGMNGLLWYYGDMGVLAVREREDAKKNMGIHAVEECKELHEKERPKQRRVERVKLRLHNTIGQMMRGGVCFGITRHFEPLD